MGADPSGLTSLDLLVMGVLGAGAFRGFFTGASRQLVSTVGWLLAFALAAALMDPVGETVVESLGASPRTAPVLGFVVVFGGVLAGVAAIGHVLRKGLEAVKLGGVDRLLGAAVGGLKAAFGLSVFLHVTGFAPLPGGGPWLISEDTRERSLLYEPVRAVAPEAWRIARAVTPGVQRTLAEKFNTWDEARRNAEDARGGA